MDEHVKFGLCIKITTLEKCDKNADQALQRNKTVQRTATVHHTNTHTHTSNMYTQSSVVSNLYAN